MIRLSWYIDTCPYARLESKKLSTSIIWHLYRVENSSRIRHQVIFFRVDLAWRWSRRSRHGSVRSEEQKVRETLAEWQNFSSRERPCLDSICYRGIETEEYIKFPPREYCRDGCTKIAREIISLSHRNSYPNTFTDVRIAGGIVCWPASRSTIGEWRYLVKRAKNGRQRFFIDKKLYVSPLSNKRYSRWNLPYFIFPSNHFLNFA